MNRIVFITGATSGFGKSIAEKFAAHGYSLIINGRRNDRLQDLKKHLEDAHQTEVKALNFDVRNKQEVTDIIDSLEEDWKKDIEILVNNAGLAAGFELIQDGNTEDWDQMIDTNVKGLLYMSKAIVPFMIEKQRGHIFNIGSTAARYVYERGNVYCATKAAVDSLSKAMRIDLLKHRIRVTAIHPGAAETEFALVRFKGDEERSKAVYKGYQPLSAEDIADAVYYCATVPPNVCIDDLVISSISQANPFYVNRK